MPYATGPYSEFPALPAPSPSLVVPTRKTDFATKRYVQDANGGIESMRDVANRVILKVAFAKIVQTHKSERENARVEQEIRAALADMEAGPEPEITIVSIVTDDAVPGVLRRTLTFRDLTTGEPGTVTL